MSDSAEAVRRPVETVPIKKSNDPSRRSLGPRVSFGEDTYVIGPIGRAPDERTNAPAGAGVVIGDRVVCTARADHVIVGGGFADLGGGWAIAEGADVSVEGGQAAVGDEPAPCHGR